MSDVTILRDARNIDLSRHGVIEAHAGTGKTHTVVETVLRILEEPAANGHDDERFVSIREVLLVTYTEKAAGELKRRIRAGLERRLGELERSEQPARPGLLQNLEDCRNNLHEALIGTIHGVCLRLLQTWPFETGAHFDTRMVDDAVGLASALRESMRTDWQDETTAIPWALSLLAGWGESIGEKHRALVRETAEKLLDRRHAVLDRGSIGGITLKDLKARYETNAGDERNGFVGAVRGLAEAIESFVPPAGFHDNAARALAAAEHWARAIIDGRAEVDPGFAGSIAAYKKPDKNGTPRSTNICDAAVKKIPSGKTLAQAFFAVQTHGYVTALRDIREKILPALACDAAELLALRWSRLKAEQGLLSFGDMLRLMYRAVRTSDEFVGSLRARLRFGIIDEFQDTSVLQWEIFRRVFLDAEAGPRLFIVGDPKQSIFSFQGADVTSYLRAKRVISEKGGRLYSLETNYRSLPETIDGCNAILGNTGDGDWFAFDSNGPNAISYPSAGMGGGLAQAVRRDVPPAHALLHPPVHVVPLEGDAHERLRRMADMAACVIESLTGTKLSIPDGAGWRAPRGGTLPEALTYGDFAIIVESHALAEPFLQRFAEAGIPAVKYKMEGLFQSAMARDVHALLRAVARPAGDEAPRLSALLTRFFNRRPRDINPEKDLEPCGRGGCANDNPCIAHGLAEWTRLAADRSWSRLFRSIFERTGVRQRLMRLSDGRRLLADLEQVCEYCLELLYRENLSLAQCVERLGMLVDGTISAGRDKDLHALATEQSSVKVLTMHAAKGLEFPVVFAVTGASKREPRAPAVLCWTDDEGKRRVMPVPANGTRDRNENPALDAANNEALIQATRERRRLLYVALTRAQAMLFAPVHLEKIEYDGSGSIDWAACRPRSRGGDADLTGRLLDILRQGNRRIRAFKQNYWTPVPADPRRPGVASAAPLLARAPDIASLDLPSRACVQTSYTQLSRRTAAEREIDRSEEDAVPPPRTQTRALPGGRETGDALHLAMEELLGLDDCPTVLENAEALGGTIRRFLDRNGVLRNLADEEARREAISHASRCVRSALTSAVLLPGGGEAAVAGIAKRDRTQEMEFLLGVGPHWVHGYMDLVFRIKNETAPHPWRYYLLDWKSDTLDGYTAETVGDRITSMHYDLQAKIYCHALDRYLGGLLGPAYDPAQNLGGAVYVFLRSFGPEAGAGAVHAWTHDPAPTADAKFTARRVWEFAGKGRSRESA
jgi:exodeoxyribonuclease V beta subunit